MSMYKNIQDILNVLWHDEELLRLLYYKPKSLSKNIPDPLDPSLQNILDMPIDKQWDIRDDVIMLTPKDDDIMGDRKCVIFAYLGDRRANRRNYQMADQQVVFDVYCHVDFENGDMRSSRISDRLNELFSLEHVTG